MKKFNRTKLMALLGALCIGTSCFVGSTLAKYTTSGNAADTARVAKFGVTVTAPVSASTFSDTYAADDTSFSLAANTVVGGSNQKVLAPGTSGTIGAPTISGTPEVAVRISNTVTANVTGQWEDGNGNFYCPIVIKNGGSVIFDGSTFTPTGTDDAVNFASAIRTAIAGVSALSVDKAAGTDLSSNVTLPTLTWEWPFEQGSDATEIAARDAKDTALGNFAAAPTAGNSAPEITLSYSTTVTQID